ncbi:hypothetical protein [Roseivirga sp.]|uniref:hypothetical protein n=1 Tax=Roseivirga sp. TaxID=1964215 RepID=UPI003B52A791
MPENRPRYQSLTREQAFGVEARLLQRVFPLFVLKDEVNPADVNEYYLNLFDLTHLLIQVGIGNKSLEEVKERAEELNKYFHLNKIFADKSYLAVEAIYLITDALSQSNRIRYYPLPGLPVHDQVNPDLVMSISTVSHAITKFNLTKETLIEPADLDCYYVLKNCDSDYLNSEFFARKLWPDNGSPTGDTGMPFPFQILILENWKNDLRSLGLTGTVKSYEGLIYGIKVRSERQLENKNSNTVINNVTINLGDGSTFTGPVSVGENIQVSYNAAASTSEEDLKVKLETLVHNVSGLIEQLPTEKEKSNVSTQLKAFVEESKKESPNEWLIKVSADGLIEAAQKLASFTEPVTSIVKEIMGLFS